MVISHKKSFCLNFTLKLLVFSSLGRVQNLPSTEEEGLGEAGKQICAGVISFFPFLKSETSFFLKSLFIFTFWSPWVFGAVSRLSLLAVGRGSSLAAVSGLLPAVPSLAVERGHWVLERQQLRLQALEHGLSRCGPRSRFAACGIFRTRNHTWVPCFGRQILIH